MYLINRNKFRLIQMTAVKKISEFWTKKQSFLFIKWQRLGIRRFPEVVHFIFFFRFCESFLNNENILKAVLTAPLYLNVSNRSQIQSSKVKLYMYKIYTTGNKRISIAEESRYMINDYPEMVPITIAFFSYTWNISISHIILYQISKTWCYNEAYHIQRKSLKFKLITSYRPRR